MIALEDVLAGQRIVCCGFTGGAVACFEGMQAPISKMLISTGIQMARTIVLDRSELKKICRAVMLESSPKGAIRNPPSQLAEGVEERPGRTLALWGRLEGNDAKQPK
jgi:hypothetical protein